MERKKGFTLAEVLTTLTIIGVVAAVTIPSLMANNRKTQFIAGMKKAVRTLDGAITLNIARGDRSALYTTSATTTEGQETTGTDNDLYKYIQKHLDIAGTTTISPLLGENIKSFLTADGMRFDFPEENSDKLNAPNAVPDYYIHLNKCGTKDMNIGGSAKAQEAYPCLVVVDVNGDKMPNRMTNDSSIGDIFMLLVTDKAVFPYGKAAQRAFYGSEQN